VQHPGDRTLEVELVEDDAADHGTDAAGAPGAGPVSRWTPSRLPREFWATVVVALVVGGTGIAVGRTGQDRMLSAHLATVDGLTESLAAPLRPAWRTPGSGLVAVTDDVVVHWDPDSPGIVGTDVHDGSSRYSMPGSCQLVSTTGERPEVFVAARLAYLAGPDDALLCLEDDLAQIMHPFGARETTARVVDPLTGETRQTIAMVAGGTWTVVDGDVVSIGLDDDRRAVAGRWSLTTGERRWAYQGTEPAPTSLDGAGTSSSDGTIGLLVGDWSVTLDLTTGAETQPEVLGSGHVTAASQRVDLPAGRTLEYHLPESGGVRTTVHPPDGGAPVTVPGFALAPTVDDGSVPGTVFVLDFDTASGTQGLRLVDLTTRRARWTAPEAYGAVGVLSGTVLIAGPDGTSAFDGSTGELLWESAAEDGSMPSAGSDLVTDGRRVLAIEGRGSARELVARDVRTGHRVWGSEPVVLDASLVPLPDGTVLAIGASEIVALRP
jgi:outer membrane protein assembly factor BamB